MSKTNKFIYPYKIEKEESFTFDSLKYYNHNNRFENFISFKEKDYKVALCFIEEDEEILYFSLIKCDNNNIAIEDFGERKEKQHYLKDDQKVKNHSFLAIIKDKDILLSLYNHRAFGYGTGSFYKYLKNKHGLKKGFTCKIITNSYSQKEIEEFLKKVKYIEIEKARENYRKYEINNRGSSRDRLNQYLERKKEFIKIEKANEIPVPIIKRIIEAFKKKKYDSIKIGVENLEEDIDILDIHYKKFACEVKTDSDGLPLFNDFKLEIQRILKENKLFFESY